MPKKTSKRQIKYAVYISDTHAGCGLALCPERVQLDDGGEYRRSKLQAAIGEMWDEFWGEWIPEVTKGEPFIVVHNGDAIDGVHHDSVTQISHNLSVQADIAHEILKHVVSLSEGRYYHIRGTEAHVGKSAQEEERLAKRLGAIPNQEGQYARYDLWLRLGDSLIHSLHHVGTTGSQAYEATAVHKELTEHFIEAARWGERPPDLIVRSHRHRCIKITIPTARTMAQAVVTPCWQGKTPFAWKIPGARLATPQFGGVVAHWVEQGSGGFIFTREKVWTIGRSLEVSADG
jgi:hypothetical protein